MKSLFHHAAVGILFDKENKRVLVSKRPSHKLKGGYWEFPGGKIEQNELPHHALMRELEEEIGIQVEHYEPFLQYEHEYQDEKYKVLLEVFLVHTYKGNPTALENQEIQWTTLEALSKLKFLEPNIEIIKHLMKKL